MNIDLLQSEMNKLITLVQAGAMPTKDLVIEFKNTLEYIDELKNEIEKKDKNLESKTKLIDKLSEEVNDLQKEVDKAKSLLVPQEKLERDREILKNSCVEFDRKEFELKIQEKYLIREAAIYRNTLSAVLTKREIVDSIFTSTISNPTGKDQYGQTLYGQEVVQNRNKCEQVTVPKLDPTIEQVNNYTTEESK